MTSPRRRLYLRVAAVLLVLAGVGAVVSAVGAWMVSGCCGSPEPAEDGYLFVGVFAAVVLWGAAYWCLANAARDRLPR